MRLMVTTGIAVIVLSYGVSAQAQCSLDHLIIGRNQDGVEGTDDDNKLFVDSRQKYRNTGEIEYANWFYPLHESIFPSFGYRVGEPGFDAFQAVNPQAVHTYDPNRSLVGELDYDYRIIVECLAMSPGIRMVHREYPQFTIDEPNDRFDHSLIHSLRGDAHVHLSYQAIDGENLHWITFRLYDEFERYEPSEPFTIVFNVEPLAGDLVVDGRVDVADLMELAYYWLWPDSSRHNDYWERADTNRDGAVNLVDFAYMAQNWRTLADQ